ncbi:hypothetical protein [Cellulomonas sp. Leaf334]|uniref:hypothetical protein n=1 Tax=Cellulomonas sp. Leaf334 TaxID=1736339 RepID=UPI0006F58D92|nr:hypothetical protein [Cellulomonas sp. Leaf334]KQR17537.1 hypothetical protein ASF78_09725 [Cellulomonas sp. Leaf334]
MVALTYDVRTVRIPVPRIVLPVRAPRRPARHALEPWQHAERTAAERRLDAHRDAALAAHR